MYTTSKRQWMFRHFFLDFVAALLILVEVVEIEDLATPFLVEPEGVIDRGAGDTLGGAKDNDPLFTT